MAANLVNADTYLSQVDGQSVSSDELETARTIVRFNKKSNQIYSRAHRVHLVVVKHPCAILPGASLR